ncbi:MAG: hypothetical protein NC095_07835 [Muribaculum sp.]|nr:hypothetical protein [Muribaculum sp.]
MTISTHVTLVTIVTIVTIVTLVTLVTIVTIVTLVTIITIFMSYIQNRTPGIVKVEYFDLDLINSDRIDLDAMSGVFPRMPEKTHEIPMIESGTAEIQSVGGAESCTISFSSNTRIRPAFRPGFIFTDANNDIYMVASSCKPFPSLEIVRTFGKMPGERPEYRYTIKHSSLMAAIPLSVS